MFLGYRNVLFKEKQNDTKSDEHAQQRHQCKTLQYIFLFYTTTQINKHLPYSED